MTKKLLATLVITLMTFALLPALSASAAPAASASLVTGADIFPGANSFQINVTNNESSFVLTPGASANYVRVLLPPNISNVACGNVSGWSCSANADTLTLRNGQLAPGRTLSIPFTGDISAPFDRDRVSSFDVRVSDDNGVTNGRAGLLDMTVRALQIIAGSLRPLSPSGVVDGTGSTGQTISYAYTVRNHARQPISPNATLTSNGDESISGGNVSVPAGGTADAVFSVRLGAVANGSANRTFTASIGNGRDVTNTFTVEALPRLNLNAPTFSPAFIRTDGTSYAFSINADKVNPPGVTGLTGTVTFAGNTYDIEQPASLLRGGGPVTISTETQIPTGSDGVYDVTFTFSGTDDNGFPYSQTTTLLQLLTIDNVGPIIDIVLRIPDGQTQVKNGDQLGVDVSVTGGTLTDVAIEASSGETFAVSGCSAGQTSCSGTATITDLGEYGTVKAVGRAADRALNTGIAETASAEFDNVLPFAFDPARIIQGGAYSDGNNVVEVQLIDRYQVHGGCNPLNWDVGEENDPIVVTEVLYSDGTTCQDGDSSPTNPNSLGSDNIRLLVTNQNLNSLISYNVRYFDNRLGFGNNTDRLEDGALNNAIDQIVTTIDGIAPALPIVGGLTRNAGAETTVFDQDIYWTRFGGNDAVATVTNAKAGYTVRVLDTDGNVLATAGADDTSADISVPIGNDEGQYVRRIQYVNNSGLLGPLLDITIELDQTDPTLAGSSPDAAADNVTVTFSEVIWDGTNAASFWFAHEVNNDPAERPYHNYQPTSVTGTGTTRVLNEIGLRNNGPYAGVSYTFETDSGSSQYEDRAGNVLVSFGPS